MRNPYVVMLETEKAELARGARMVRMRQEPADVTLEPEKSVRLFTNRLGGCVAIARVALLETGRRLAYMQHAFYGDVCDNNVTIEPSTAAGIVASKGIVMARSFEPLAPFKASRTDIPYEEMSGGEYIRPIVETMAEVCGADEAVTICPYYEGSTKDPLYTGTLVVDVPPYVMGTILAEGQAL